MGGDVKNGFNEMLKLGENNVYGSLDCLTY